MDSEYEEAAQGANRTVTASTRKTAPHGRFRSYYGFASHSAGAVDEITTRVMGALGA